MSDWLTTSGNDYGALAKLIIVTELPYEVGDKPDKFKRDSQVDNRPKYWPYPPADTTAWIERSFRIPMRSWTTRSMKTATSRPCSSGPSWASAWATRA